MARPIHISSLQAHERLTVRTFELAQPERSAAHFVHSHATIVYLDRGEAAIWCGCLHRLRPGDALIIPEGLPHYLASAREVKVTGLALCSACLRSPAGRELAALWRVGEGGAQLRTIAAESRATWSWVLAALADELGGRDARSDTRGDAWHELAVEGYLALIAATLRRATPAATPLADARGVSLSAQALAFITAEATRGISLDDVARHLCRSAAHTATVVKQDTGRTVVEWITHSRMAAARQLLLKTDETVELIASRVGFASPSHFHCVFKRLHGATPTAWRAVHLERAVDSPD